METEARYLISGFFFPLPLLRSIKTITCIKDCRANRMDASAEYFYFYETGLFYKESVFLFLFVFTCSV